MNLTVATGTPRVVIGTPDRALPLLFCLLLMLAALLAFTVLALREAEAARDEAHADADFWLELAVAEDTTPRVAIERDGVGFRCEHFHVRREWERVIEAECERMGALLIQGRAAP